MPHISQLCARQTADSAVLTVRAYVELVDVVNMDALKASVMLKRLLAGGGYTCKG